MDSMNGALWKPKYTMNKSVLRVLVQIEKVFH